MATGKKEKAKKIVLLILVFVGLLILVPLTRTIIATELYSFSNKSRSKANASGLQIEIPSGEATSYNDWFPNMVWFHDSYYGGEAFDVTVLYSYGAFNNPLGTSSYYDQDSKYYGSFYGAYLIKNDNGEPFGFDSDGNVIIEDIMGITAHDQTKFVLPALGCPKAERIFEITKVNAQGLVSYAGYDNWQKFDSKILTNGPAHGKKEWQRGYWQYGLPMSPNEGSYDFEPKDFCGRIYVKYFEEYETTICLYMMCFNQEILERTDNDILQKTKIQ